MVQLMTRCRAGAMRLHDPGGVFDTVMYIYLIRPHKLKSNGLLAVFISNFPADELCLWA